jgi:hypothetical protein
VAALFVALIHHPVLDRNGRVVTSAITSLDLHDIARASHTYGVQAFFVVHPVAEQRDFAGRVLDHWRLGYGREYDSRRREALDLIEVVSELDEAVVAAERACAQRPLLVYTSARTSGGTSYESLRARIEAEESAAFLLMFGTGFGLAPALLERADLRLAPIQGPSEYNHLSVRAAAGIILDRLRGRRP